MNRQVLLVIMSSALLVSAVAVTFALAFDPGDSQCRLASASEFKAMSDPASSRGPSGESKDVTKSGSDKAVDPFTECYQTCRIDEAQSRFMKQMCWLNCAYSAYGVPAGM